MSSESRGKGRRTYTLPDRLATRRKAARVERESARAEEEKGFEQAASVAKPNPTSLVGPVRSVYEAEFDTAYRARYVRIHFDVQVNTFTDEIEVYGGALSGGDLDRGPDHRAI